MISSGGRSGLTQGDGDVDLVGNAAAGHGSRSVVIHRALVRASVLVFGCVLQFDIATATFGLPFVRLSDGLLFIFVPYLALIAGLRTTLRYGLPFFAILLLVTVTTIALKTEPANGDVYLVLIFLLSSVYAFYFVVLARDEGVLVSFAIGTLAGFVGSVTVLFLQVSGVPLLSRIGLGIDPDLLASGAAMIAEAKPGGLWSSGNEAGHVYALVAASALYLSLRWRNIFVYLGYFVLMVVSVAATLNRGGIFAPVALLLLCYRRLASLHLVVGTLVALALGVALAGALEPKLLDQFGDAMEQRFLNDSHAAANVDERWETIRAGLGIAFANPFGIGYEERAFRMETETPNGRNATPHNAFITLAFQNGVVVPLLFIAACIYMALRWRRTHPFMLYLIGCAIVSMLFEELSINPNFIFVVALVIASLWVSLCRRWETGREEATRPDARRIWSRSSAPVWPDVPMAGGSLSRRAGPR